MIHLDFSLLISMSAIIAIAPVRIMPAVPRVRASTVISKVKSSLLLGHVQSSIHDNLQSS